MDASVPNGDDDVEMQSGSMTTSRIIAIMREQRDETTTQIFQIIIR